MASTGGTVTADAAPSKARTRIEYRRFNVFHRWMHFLVFVSFTVLVFTGMPLKYKDAEWARWFMDLFGGVTAAGVYHRIAAIITVFYWTLEFTFMVVMVLRSRGKLLRSPGSMMPGKKDLEDIIGMFAWFFGKGPKPQFDRYTYWEKFDYMSLMAGTVIIGMTGFMMWFPLWFTKVLPGVFLNIALVIHSNEALLAMGVIFIFVHFFSAHVKPESFPLDKVDLHGLAARRALQGRAPARVRAPRARGHARRGPRRETHHVAHVRGRCPLVDHHRVRRFLRYPHDGVHHLVGVRLTDLGATGEYGAVLEAAGR